MLHNRSWYDTTVCFIPHTPLMFGLLTRRVLNRDCYHRKSNEPCKYMNDTLDLRANEETLTRGRNKSMGESFCSQDDPCCN